MNDGTADRLNVEAQAELGVAGNGDGVYHNEEARTEASKFLPPEVQEALDTLEAHSRAMPNFHYTVAFAVIDGEEVRIGFQVGAALAIAFGLSQELAEHVTQRAASSFAQD